MTSAGGDLILASQTAVLLRPHDGDRCISHFGLVQPRTIAWETFLVDLCSWSYYVRLAGTAVYPIFGLVQPRTLAWETFLVNLSSWSYYVRLAGTSLVHLSISGPIDVRTAESIVDPF